MRKALPLIGVFLVCVKTVQVKLPLGQVFALRRIKCYFSLVVQLLTIDPDWMVLI